MQNSSYVKKTTLLNNEEILTECKVNFHEILHNNHDVTQDTTVYRTTSGNCNLKLQNNSLITAVIMAL